MTDDDGGEEFRSLGPEGLPVPLDRKERYLRPSPKQRRLDPLDVAAQQVHGRRTDKLVLDEPNPEVCYDNQIFWCIVGRIDGGPWSHLVAAQSMSASTYTSRRRAEATLVYLRRVASNDSNGCEYRVIPVMAGQRRI